MAVQQCLYLRQTVRPIACADDADMCIAYSSMLILIIKESDTGKREIALPLSEFPEGAAPILGPERQVQLRDDLVRLAQRRQRAGEEFAGPYCPSSGGADEGDLSLARHGDSRQFRGRI